MAHTIFQMNKYELGLTKSILKKLTELDDEHLAKAVYTENNIQLLLRDYYDLVREVYEERYNSGYAQPQ